jgi:hypothetical protein
MPAESATCVRRLDKLYTAYPFLGSRRMTAVLRAEELSINRKRVQRPMRRPLPCEGTAIPGRINMLKPRTHKLHRICGDC